MPLLSAHEFNKLCKWSYCPIYSVKLNTSFIKENDLVFLNLDYFIQFVSILYQNPPKHKFILIIHNSNQPFTIEHFNKIFNFTNRIYAINNLVGHPIVNVIPIGFKDDKHFNHNNLQSLLDKKINKDILLYSNFSVDANKGKRLECLNSFLNKRWTFRDQKLNIESFYRKINRSKFVLCPEGIGIDNHKIYECIYFNSIPIIKKTRLDYFYINLPILIIEKWSDITKEFLENNYETYLNGMIQWKNIHSNWTTAKYWIGIKN